MIVSAARRAKASASTRDGCATGSCRGPAARSVTVLQVGATPPHKLGHARVLRYRGDVAADWSAERDAAVRSFQGAVVALAIVQDEASGGVFTLFLYADGTVADQWQESLDDALSALEETSEFDGLPWADLAHD